jgi:pimeloyl-ACP methyl ester carboxylesterase
MKLIAAILLWILALVAPAAAAEAVSVVPVRIPADDGVALAGELHLPPGPGRHPAIVFVHGSERATAAQDFDIVGLQRAVDAGFAVLVIDKRGLGATPGQFQESADIEATAADVLAQVRFLRARPDIRANGVGLYGVSRGGWVAPLAATRSSDVAFVVMVSGPAVTPNEANIYQRGQELLAAGASAEDVAAISAYRQVLWPYLGSGQGFDAASAAWEQAKGQPWAARLEGFERPFPPEALAADGFAYFRAGVFDPYPVLARLRTPVFAAFGSNDRLIPVERSMALMRQAFAGHPDATIRLFEGAGHGMRLPRPAGAPADQAPPFVDGYWPTVIAWLAAHDGN